MHLKIFVPKGINYKFVKTLFGGMKFRPVQVKVETKKEKADAVYTNHKTETNKKILEVDTHFFALNNGMKLLESGTIKNSSPSVPLDEECFDK
jgi:hypothetical protein